MTDGATNVCMMSLSAGESNVSKNEQVTGEGRVECSLD